MPYTIILQDHIIASANKRIIRITQKHGIELPTSVTQDKKLDEKNGNNLWMNAVNRETENLKVVFEILEDEAKIPVGHNKAYDHLVFDVHIDLERKIRWVKDGHMTPELE